MLICTAAWSIDIRQSHNYPLNMIIVLCERKAQSLFDVAAQGIGQCEISCLNVYFHPICRI